MVETATILLSWIAANYISLLLSFAMELEGYQRFIPRGEASPIMLMFSYTIGLPSTILLDYAEAYYNQEQRYHYE